MCFDSKNTAVIFIVYLNTKSTEICDNISDFENSVDFCFYSFESLSILLFLVWLRFWCNSKVLFSLKKFSTRSDLTVCERAVWPLRGPSADRTLLSLRGTSRKMELIEIHENFIRNLEASVKPSVSRISNTYSLFFFRAHIKRCTCDSQDISTHFAM